eukprot:scaffold1984_cov99-Cylindrotheca_fusiformis.AAC.6
MNEWKLTSTSIKLLLNAPTWESCGGLPLFAIRKSSFRTQYNGKEVPESIYTVLDQTGSVGMQKISMGMG